MRKFETALGDLGYVYDRRNSKGFLFWIHEDSGAELRTVAHMTDSPAATRNAAPSPTPAPTWNASVSTAPTPS